MAASRPQAPSPITMLVLGGALLVCLTVFALALAGGGGL